MTKKWTNKFSKERNPKHLRKTTGRDCFAMETYSIIKAFQSFLYRTRLPKRHWVRNTTGCERITGMTSIGDSITPETFFQHLWTKFGTHKEINVRKTALENIRFPGETATILSMSRMACIKLVEKKSTAYNDLGGRSSCVWLAVQLIRSVSWRISRIEKQETKMQKAQKQNFPRLRVRVRYRL